MKQIQNMDFLGRIAEVDVDELAVRLCEANYRIVRPRHLNATEALAAMDADVRDGWQRSAHVAVGYLMQCIARSEP